MYICQEFLLKCLLFMHLTLTKSNLLWYKINIVMHLIGYYEFFMSPIALISENQF